MSEGTNLDTSSQPFAGLSPALLASVIIYVVSSAVTCTTKACQGSLKG